MFKIKTSEIVFTEEETYKEEFQLNIYTNRYVIELWFLEYKDVEHIQRNLDTEPFINIKPKDSVIKVNQVEQTVL